MNTGTANPAPADADPALHELYRRWVALVSNGRLPSAADMNFEDLVAEFGGAAMIEVQRRSNSSPRYCYTRVGPAHAEALGRDIQGYSIDELVAPQVIHHFEDVYDRIVESGQPHYWMRINALRRSNLNTFERLLVPVADDGETVDALVGVWAWFDL